MSPPVILQLSPMLPAIEDALRARYTVLRMPSRHASEAERTRWLETEGPSVRVVLTGGHLGIDTELARRLPNLGLVAVNGAGYDRIDLDAMRALGVVVSNTPDVLTDDVADLAIALMLNVLRALPAAEALVRRGDWPQQHPPLGRRASGLNYGVVGLGRIGQAIARRLAGFGGRIAYTGPNRKASEHRFHERLIDLARESDVLFIANAATAATRGMVDRPILDALGPRGVLINVGRGSVVDEPAMIAALADGRLGGAGLDVFANEPNVPERLRTLPNVALSPHIGSATVETRAAMGQLMLDNVDAFLTGRPLPSRIN
ncbi:2-hydroxyacid dehydrogenase [Acetobacteraceae bacterium KSS8]|uniref:2-hydroxyacid dehydrogenase n=1 Tax=Endosaccharibacter trunci TaxID=2812733 RepID=A0ABT1W6L0_9PROT|nr:2-hydroxyacid dehydrogenase [Acetobacteraceae bacterium KSS8]